MYFFTADEHYGHTNFIKFGMRPFKDVHEMNKEITKRHNEVIGKGDIVIHAGDFCWSGTEKQARRTYIQKLNGQHVFLRGNHDSWMNRSFHEVWEKTIDGQHVVVCHYAMRVWSRSHYGSWMLYGHSHGKLAGIKNSMDIGVDTHNFYPWSWEEVREELCQEKD